MIKKNFYIYASVFIILCLFVFLQIKNYQKIKNHEIYHAKTISTIIEKYLYSAFYSTEIIEDLYLERYISLLQSIDFVSKELLDDLKIENYTIIDLDTFETIKYNNEYIITTNQDFISEILEQVKNTQEYFFIEHYDEISDNLSIAQISNSKLYIITINTPDLQQYLKPLFFKEIFNNINDILKNDFEKDKLFKYAAIQDFEGIIAGTSELTNLEKIETSQFLMNIYNQKTGDFRLIEINNDKYLEIVNPITYNNEVIALIRFCIDAQNIENALYQTIFYIFIYILLFTMLIIVISLINLHNKKVLNINKELEKSKHLAEIGELGAELAHEIKNPLNTISMIIQRIKNSESLKSENKNYLDLSYSEIQRLNDTINKFLQYSKFDELSFKKTDINQVFLSILSLYEVKAKNEDIELKILTSKTIYTFIDENAVKQVMINMINNSFESLNTVQKKNKYINISCKHISKHIEIIIEDNGNGIDHKSIDKVFDLFFSKKENGSGIGLANAKKLIKAHNGIITCNSQEGKGTTMTIILPIKTGGEFETLNS